MNNDDNTIELNLPPPSAKQQEAIYYASQAHPCTTVTMVAGRRAGKSHGLKYILMMFSFAADNVTTWYVSYTDTQASDFFYSFLSDIQKGNIIKSVSHTPGNYCITFINESKIYFKSSKAKDGLRGGDGLDFLVCDEFAFYKPEIYEKILYPQIATKRPSGLIRKTVIASSPRGKTNNLYKFYSFGQKSESEYRHFASVKFNIYDNPLQDDNFINSAKLTMSDAQFRQEILGEFVDDAQVFNHVSECATIEFNQEYNPTRIYYLGVDVGLKKDASVLSIVSSRPGSNNSAVQLVAQYSFRNMLSTDLEDTIVGLNKKWKFKQIKIESNSSGLPIITNLTVKHKLYNIEPFNTNGKTKPIIVNQGAHLFNNKNIDIIKDSELIDELNDFIITETENGNLKYEGLDSDDRVMSLLIAVDAWINCRNSGEYYIKVI